jgi:predicted MFS family arabinose efflux permease
MRWPGGVAPQYKNRRVRLTVKERLRSLYADSQSRYFLATVLAFGVAAGLFAGVLNNYLHEILHITRVERGLVEFPRELPGLLLIFIIALLYRFSEVSIMRLALLASLAGMIGIVFVGKTRVPAIAMIVLWSTGEHMLMPVRSSIAVHMAQRGKEGLALGGVTSVGNAGMMLGHFLVPALLLALGLAGVRLSASAEFGMLFVVAAAVVFVALMAAMGMRPHGRHVERKRMYISRRYGRYYVLETLFGARKQVFMTFAPYVLITTYGAGTELISSLLGVAPLANIFFSPVVGTLIDRFGYKRILLADSSLLFVLCILYGWTHRVLPPGAALVVISCVFVLDAMLFVVGMARTMYVKSIAESQDEVTSTLSTGLSINHLVSIVIAMAGGVFWAKMGTELLFSAAALFMVGSFLFSLTLPRHER